MSLRRPEGISAETKEISFEPEKEYYIFIKTGAEGERPGVDTDKREEGKEGVT